MTSLNKQVTTQEYLEKVKELKTLLDNIINQLPKLEPDTYKTKLSEIKIDHTAKLSKEVLNNYFEYWTKAKYLIKNILGDQNDLLSAPFVTNQQKFNFLLNTSKLFNYSNSI